MNVKVITARCCSMHKLLCDFLLTLLIVREVDAKGYAKGYARDGWMRKRSDSGSHCGLKEKISI